ncbi:hypothetical protein SPFM9_00210 [Salmonella phage SPFM9]|nr:hypothetical protein SPFM9_00210 [Salmonella phage SPFM9]
MRFEHGKVHCCLFCGMIKERFPDIDKYHITLALRSIFPEMEKAAKVDPVLGTLLAKYKEELKKTAGQNPGVLYFENDGVAGCGFPKTAGVKLLFFYSIVKRSIKMSSVEAVNGEKTAPVLY